MFAYVRLLSLTHLHSFVTIILQIFFLVNRTILRYTYGGGKHGPARPPDYCKREDSFVKTIKQPAGENPAIIGHTLAQNTDLFTLFAIVERLRKDYRAGRLEVPAIIDLSEYASAEDAELVAAFALAIRG